jgi:hypothetical protein
MEIQENGHFSRESHRAPLEFWAATAHPTAASAALDRFQTVQSPRSSARAAESPTALAAQKKQTNRSDLPSMVTTHQSHKATCPNLLHLCLTVGGPLAKRFCFGVRPPPLQPPSQRTLRIGAGGRTVADLNKIEKKASWELGTSSERHVLPCATPVSSHPRVHWAAAPDRPEVSVHGLIVAGDSRTRPLYSTSGLWLPAARRISNPWTFFSLLELFFPLGLDACLP